MSEREQKRLNGVITAIAESEIEGEDYSEEDVEKRKAEFPKILKYFTEDEDESYYIKSKKEIWLEEGFFSNNATLLITLTEAYLKSKGIEKGTKDYIDRFENIVLEYVQSFLLFFLLF